MGPNNLLKETLQLDDKSEEVRFMLTPVERIHSVFVVKCHRVKDSSKIACFRYL